MYARITRLSTPSVVVLLTLAIAGCRGLSGNVPSTISAGATAKVTQRFGMHMHDPIHHWPSVTFGYWRVWDAGVSWPQIETARGTYDFSLLDQYVALAEQHNVKIIYCAGNTPQWASSNPSLIGTQGPGASAPPSNIQDWADFIRTLATHYKGKIYAYEIWNEVDLSPDYWIGSVSQMVSIAQTAYQTIKEVDPAAIVLAPSVVQNKGRDYLKNFFNAGGDKYSDAVAYHLYDVSAEPELIVSDVYQAATDVAHQWGKEIWDTEVGWGPWATPSSDEQAVGFTARTMILQAASGINVIVWFAWDDRDWVHLPFVGPDFQTPTPAAIAFQQVQAWLLNSTITCSNTPDSTWQCPVVSPDGTQRYIVWNVLGSTSFSIPSTWQVTKSSDLAGNTHQLSGSSITINDDPVLLSR